MGDAEHRQKVALFRFGIISQLVSRTNVSRGERERMVRAITEKEWEIPTGGRTHIGRSTVLRWLNAYRQAGEHIEALEPRPRKDRGGTRCVTPELELALVSLRRELIESTLPVLLRVARERGIVTAESRLSPASLYRLFKRHGLERPQAAAPDRRRFEAELANDLWQSDCLHGPKVLEDGKLRQSFLFAIIDDHSRLVVFARSYLSERLESFQDCLIEALARRGLPRKLFVDNGASFRNHTLRYACGRLGIALLHATPYTPEGKGKIERLFKTMRTQLFPLLPQTLTLKELNERLTKWVEEDYHQRVHSSTGQKPLERYLEHVSLLRKAPEDLREYFRTPLKRKVDKDRTVSLFGRLYEAPTGLIGNNVTVLYHPSDLGRIEVIFQERSWGFLTPLSPTVNCRVRRVTDHRTELVEPPQNTQATEPVDRGGKLFGRSVS
jgi:transposase InsO family protein